MFKVAEKCCDQCLFGPHNIVREGRKEDVLEECARTDSHFVCHKTEDVCCRGFYDTQTSNLIRIARRLGAIEEVDVMKLKG